MNIEPFKTDQRKLSVICLIQEVDLAKQQTDLNELGNLKHVKLIVQPCSFEGIEFLYRVPLDIPGQQTSFDREIYWHAVPLDKKTSAEDFSKFSQHHYDFIVAILEQNVKKVASERKAINLFLER